MKGHQQKVFVSATFFFLMSLNEPLLEQLLQFSHLLKISAKTVQPSPHALCNLINDNWNWFSKTHLVCLNKSKVIELASESTSSSLQKAICL